MSGADPLALDRRRRIYQMIVEHPGLHLRELERRLGVGLGDLRHHLDRLEEEGLIASRADGYRKVYVSTRGFFIQDTALVALLRQSSTRAIIVFLMERDRGLFEEIRDHLRVSKSTLSFHLRKLVDGGVLTVTRDEGRLVYRIADKERVAQMFIAYRASFVDAAIDRVARAWMP